MTVRVLTVAQAELEEAIDWYHAISSDLGSAFLIEAIRVIRLIEQHPDAWHPIGRDMRRCRLARFPYGVVYTPEDSGQLVIAVAHLHRAPLYWRDRLKPD